MMETTGHPMMALPLELFRAVLAEVMLARGVKRALRLRLVNRFFSDEVMRLLSPLRLLDGCKRRTRGMGKMGADYLTYRLLHTSLPVHPDWAQIRRIATRLALEDDEDVKNYAYYVKILCYRAAEYNDPYMSIACAEDWFPERGPDVEYDYNLLAAAAYTNKCRIIEEFVEQPPNLKTIGNLFSHPHVCAAEAGHDEALDLLFAKFETRKSFLLKDVACRASTRMVKRFMPEQPVKWHPYMSWPNPNEVLYDTPNVETFEMLLAIYPKEHVPEQKFLNTLLWMLEHAVCQGWEDIIRRIINMVEPKDRQYGKSKAPVKFHISASLTCFNDLVSPLTHACRRGYEGIVELLIEHGEHREEDNLTAAAKGGHLNLVVRLIKTGSDPNKGLPLPIVSAISLERKDLFRALFEHGSRLDGDFGAVAVSKAREEGLTSMLTLLEEHGVNING